jgi:hypothetical protein
MRDTHVGSVVTGSLLSEPVEVLALVPMGVAIKLTDEGLKTGPVRDPVLARGQPARLRATPGTGHSTATRRCPASGSSPNGSN